MQPEIISTQHALLAEQVLDLIRVLRLAYSPIMIGADASAQVHHALDILGGEVARLAATDGRQALPRLALVPADTPPDASAPAAALTAAPTLRIGSASSAPATVAPIAASRSSASVIDPTSAPAPMAAVEAETGDPGDEPVTRAAAAAPASASAPPALGKEPRDDVGRVLRSAVLADLARRSTRAAGIPSALRTGPNETTTCPASDASASTTAVRTDMPSS